MVLSTVQKHTSVIVWTHSWLVITVRLFFHLFSLAKPKNKDGPILKPFLVRVVHAEVKLNPLIEPVPDTGPERPFLKWNMLFHTSLVQRPTDPAHVSWSKGRNAPATFPRVTSMRIVSDIYPWMIEVHAQTEGRGVTCGEVIKSIYQNMQRLAQRNDYERLSAAKTDFGRCVSA